MKFSSNSKELSVTNSCNYNENLKMAKVVYRQIPASQGVPLKIPTSGQKLRCKSPRKGQFHGANS